VPTCGSLSQSICQALQATWGFFANEQELKAFFTILKCVANMLLHYGRAR